MRGDIKTTITGYDTKYKSTVTYFFKDGEKNVVKFDGTVNEKDIREFIEKCAWKDELKKFTVKTTAYKVPRVIQTAII